MSAPTSDPAPFPRPGDAGAGDLLLLAFADEEARLYGCGRVELDRDGRLARSHVAVFEGADPLAVAAGEAPPAPDRSAEIDGGALVLRDEEAGDWTASFSGGAGGAGAFTLVCRPLERWAAAAPEGGERHVQRLRVEGELRGAGAPVAVRAVGQLTFSRGVKTPEGSLTRDLAVWVAERLTIDLHATRDRSSAEHEREHVSAVIVTEDPPSVQAIEGPRLSTTYDADGRPLRAGLELWPDEESAYPRRAAGEAVCATSVTTTAGRWDCAFMRWHIESGVGVGPYALWRPAPSGDSR